MHIMQVKMKSREGDFCIHFQGHSTMYSEDRERSLVAQNTYAVSLSCKKNLTILH